MHSFWEALLQAWWLLVSFDPELYEIIALSLMVSTASVLAGSILGIPLGILLGTNHFFGKRFLVHVINTFVGLPPVVVGLAVFLLFSRQGSLGEWGLLFTPIAMAVAQTLLVLPIIISLTNSAIAEKDPLLQDTAYTLGANFFQTWILIILESRYSITAAIVTGFGRAISEVGAVLLVGGNIKHSTRTMTTAIAMQTTMGEFEIALALGAVLLGLSFLINLVFTKIQAHPR